MFGTPVHYASAAGATTSFMDHLFFEIYFQAEGLLPKAGSAVVSARRTGTTVVFDQIKKYFTISQMPNTSSRYWNMFHGATPEDVQKDLEWFQAKHVLARNMGLDS